MIWPVSLSLFLSVTRNSKLKWTLLLMLFVTAEIPAFAQTWTLSWSDEFSGTTINSANWTYDTGTLNVNNEVEYYCAPSSNTAPCDSTVPNAYLDGSGHLVIQALRINSGVAPYSGSWTSARLNSSTLQSFQYGRIESSMSLPLGPGLWPAFWALGTNITTVGWPASGEIDYMENVPLTSGLGPSTISSTLNGGYGPSDCYCGGNGLGQRYTFPATDPNGPDVTSFHTYGAIWSPNMVQFYVDDPTNVFFVRTAADVPSGFTWDYNHPFFLLLNLAVGGTGSWPGPPDNTTPSPAVMSVDYVRVYTPSQVPPPTMMAPLITLNAGSTGSSTVALNSTSGTGRVYLSCSTNAPKATCAVNTTDPLDQYTVDFSSASSTSATVTVNTTANTNHRAALAVSETLWPLTGILPVALVLPVFSQRRKYWAVFSGTLLALSLLLACGGSNNTQTPGGGGGTPNGTPPGNYTITVNAYTVSNTTGTADAALNIPLTVN
ncbi:MAG TPA: glycoside hydrolase family 16 protein [Candidatus Sulfotelmatobacter sp.]|nr:glycoside hydrolase family 16 protein [Candidatus Sulfotelmatobacter sp.]